MGHAGNVGLHCSTPGLSLGVVLSRLRVNTGLLLPYLTWWRRIARKCSAVNRCSAYAAVRNGWKHMACCMRDCWYLRAEIRKKITIDKEGYISAKLAKASRAASRARHSA